MPGIPRGPRSLKRPMHRLEEGGAGPATIPVEPSSETRQRRRMLAALAVLLLALILLVLRNRQFLYPETAASGTDVPSETAQEPKAQIPTATPPAIASTTKPAPIANSRSRTSAPPKHDVEMTAPPAVATAERAVLPALQVEVVAGDNHRTVRPGSNSVKVDMQPGSPVDRLSGDPEVASNSPTVDASERVRMLSDNSSVVTHQITPDYPLLAKQMKVQGAVILQALIGKEGKIQDLRVVSGPSILSSAAREAVKQWRFKPYYQAGAPVETQARITVNFTILTN